MAIRKSRNQTWLDVKLAMSDLNERQLIGLLSDLYRLSGENQTFLHARFAVGDIDEDFYDALNRMYQRATTKILTLREKEQSKFRSRLKAIMISSSDIGWGYHDMLCDDYYEAFPENE